MRGAWCWLALGLVAAPVQAQESLFSLQFLGIDEETADMRARAMGTQGIALDDAHTSLTLNPGSLAALDRMTIGVIGGAGSRTVSDGTLHIDRGESTIPHMRFALPVPGKFVLSVGLLSLRNYRSAFTLPPDQIDELQYLQSFARKGSLYTVPLGVARPLGSHLHVGATIDFVLGTVDDSWVSVGDSLLSLRTRRADGLGGTTVTLGAVATPWRALRVGGAWTPSVNLDRTTTTTIEDARLNAGVRPIRSSVLHSKTRLPATYRAGIALNLGRSLLVSGDALYRDWADYEGRLYGAEAVGTEARYGGGVELHPHRPTWWGRLAYRAGASRSQWPQQVGGNDLLQTTGVVGLGFDLKGGFGRLDTGLEYARIGSIDRNGYEESRWTFLVSISGQETWRRRSPRQPTQAPPAAPEGQP